MLASCPCSDIYSPKEARKPRPQPRNNPPCGPQKADLPGGVRVPTPGSGEALGATRQVPAQGGVCMGPPQEGPSALSSQIGTLPSCSPGEGPTSGQAPAFASPPPPGPSFSAYLTPPRISTQRARVPSTTTLPSTRESALAVSAGPISLSLTHTHTHTNARTRARSRRSPTLSVPRVGHEPGAGFRGAPEP